jgi:hypothetical protein
LVTFEQCAALVTLGSKPPSAAIANVVWFDWLSEAFDQVQIGKQQHRWRLCGQTDLWTCKT